MKITKLVFGIGILVLMTISLTLSARSAPLPAIPNSSSGQDTGAQTMPVDQIIVKYKDSADLVEAEAAGSETQMQQLSEVAGVELEYFRPMSGESHVLRLPGRIPVDQVLEITDRLAALPEVEYAEPDYMVQAVGNPSERLLLAPDDPMYANQWHYFAPGSDHWGVNVPAAWDITTGSSGVYVAVIDTGILNHTDLSGRWIGGYDFITSSFTANDGDGRDANPLDPGDWTTDNECFFGWPALDSSWHGTHVAGTIAAASNNGSGVAGLNWVSRVVPVRVLGKCGGTNSDLADAMRWAAGLPVAGVPANANPAKVISMSLGYYAPTGCPVALQEAANDVAGAGSVSVVAAGNSNDNASLYAPGNCQNVITVAATNRNGGRAYYSNYGTAVEIAAPGGETNISASNGVLSTLNTGTTTPENDAYVYYPGTSMATPHVAGVVSLMYSVNPALTPGQVLSFLIGTATIFPTGTGNDCTTTTCGSGIVNAAAAITAAGGSLGDELIFLPLVFRPGSSSPVNLVNGDFEQGSGVGWTEFSSNGFDVILNGGFPGSVTPHSGSWAAWLGGFSEETSYLQQQVTVPPGTPYLAYYHWIASEDICGFDFASVRINGAVIQQYDLCDPADTGGWVRHTVDLGAYSGQSVTLQIRAATDTSGNSNLFVDDVSFSASATMPGERSFPVAPSLMNDMTRSPDSGKK